MDESPKIPIDLERDPDILAEKKRNLLSTLRLERYMNIAKATGFFLRTFKSEAVSLVSGVGTLVLGWRQLAKYTRRGSQEVRTESTWDKKEPRVHRRDSSAALPVTGVPEVPTGATITMSVSNEILAAPMQDPGNWSFGIMLITLVISSAIAYFKKRRKGTERERGSDVV